MGKYPVCLAIIYDRKRSRHKEGKLHPNAMAKETGPHATSRGPPGNLSQLAPPPPPLPLPIPSLHRHSTALPYWRTEATAPAPPWRAGRSKQGARQRQGGAGTGARSGQGEGKGSMEERACLRASWSAPVQPATYWALCQAGHRTCSPLLLHPPGSTGAPRMRPSTPPGTPARPAPRSRRERLGRRRLRA